MKNSDNISVVACGPLRLIKIFFTSTYFKLQPELHPGNPTIICLLDILGALKIATYIPNYRKDTVKYDGFSFSFAAPLNR